MKLYGVTTVTIRTPFIAQPLFIRYNLNLPNCRALFFLFCPRPITIHIHISRESDYCRHIHFHSKLSMTNVIAKAHTQKSPRRTRINTKYVLCREFQLNFHFSARKLRNLSLFRANSRRLQKKQSIYKTLCYCYDAAFFRSWYFCSCMQQYVRFFAARVCLLEVPWRHYNAVEKKHCVLKKCGNAECSRITNRMQWSNRHFLCFRGLKLICPK